MMLLGHASIGRCATCGCRSPTAATSAANYCMPEDGLRLAAARGHAALRGDQRAGRRLRRRSASTSCASPAASRCCAATSPALVAHAGRASPALARSRDDDQRRPARRSGRRRSQAAGLRRITVSLDTLQRRSLQRADALRRARRACSKASPRRRRVFGRLKIDTVVIRGVNDDELVDLIEFGKTVNAEVRFIEYMDVGGATHWSPAASCRAREMLDALAGALRADRRRSSKQSSAPADRYRAAGRHVVRHHRVDDRAVLPAAATAAG